MAGSGAVGPRSGWPDRVGFRMGLTAFDWHLSAAHPGAPPHDVGLDRNELELTLPPL